MAFSEISKDNLEKFLMQTLDVVPAVIYSKSFPGLKYLFVNKKFHEVVDSNIENFMGLTDDIVFLPEVAKTLSKNDREIAKKKEVQHFEERVPHPDGTFHDYDTYKFPMLDENGDVYAVTGISLDITERKKTESVLRTSMKLASLGEMAGGIAHEINNPLAIIDGTVKKMTRTLEQENSIDKVFFQKMTKKISEMTSRMSKIINGLLVLGREGALDQHVDTDSAWLFETVLELVCANVTYKGIEIKKQFPSKSPLVKANVVQMSQVLLNVLENACYEAKKAESNWVEVRVIETSTTVLFEVVNVCSDCQGRIVEFFRPFFTTKPLGEGTGLGLSISKGIVENHSGTISAKFLDEKTICFTVEIPKSSEMS